jgi:hypothetical protein
VAGAEDFKKIEEEHKIEEEFIGERGARFARMREI